MCILYSCSVPVILRTGNYLLVGERYMYTVVDGEAKELYLCEELVMETLMFVNKTKKEV